MEPIEEKCLRNSKISFDGVFLSIYSHLPKKLKLSWLCRKKYKVKKNKSDAKVYIH